MQGSIETTYTFVRHFWYEGTFEACLDDFFSLHVEHKKLIRIWPIRKPYLEIWINFLHADMTWLLNKTLKMFVKFDIKSIPNDSSKLCFYFCIGIWNSSEILRISVHGSAWRRSSSTCTNISSALARKPTKCTIILILLGPRDSQ